MRKKIYDQLHSLVQSTVNLGIAHLTMDLKEQSSDNITIKGREYVNFSLCDYLALSKDERLKQGAIKAVNDYGAYTTVSKVYLKEKIFEIAEDYLSQIFKKPVVLFPRTTMAHIGVLPVITDTDEAIILDHQVHASMQIASDMLRGQGNYVETIRHNRMDILEDRIKELSKKYKKVWYLADSIYSMYGDTLPYNEIIALLDKYEQFRLYVDDAHGMSWEGENGFGFLLNHMPYHEHMILITSLGKGFGGGGGIAVCYDDKLRDRLLLCAAPLIFSLPVTPPSLGCIIESSKIHLTTEIQIRQIELKERIDLFHSIAREMELPIISKTNTPIAFIAAGKPDTCQDLCVALMNRGFYVCPSHYPAVPLNSSGLRVSLSLHQSKDDIRNLLKAIKEEYDSLLVKKNVNIEQILRHYKIAEPAA